MPYTGIKAHLNGHNIEQVRVEFEQLYKNEKLKDIVRIFQARGITASVRHWKAQICQWNIRKNNNEVEMTFAKTKARIRKERLGKDTAFSIRGQRRTIHDIDLYFSRKRDSRDAIAIAKTPEGIKYFTPSPSPPLAPLPMVNTSEAVNFTAENNDKLDDLNTQTRIHGCSILQSLRSRAGMNHQAVPASSFGSFSTYISTTNLGPSLRLPDSFENARSTLLTFCELCSKALASEQISEETFAKSTYGINNIHNNVYNIFLHLKHDRPFSAELCFRAALEDIAAISRRDNFTEVFSVLIMFELIHRDSVHAIKEHLRLAFRSLLKSLSPDSPVQSLFKTLLLSSFRTSDLLEQCLLAGNDLLNANGASNSYFQFELLYLLSRLYRARSDWYGCLKCIKALPQQDLNGILWSLCLEAGVKMEMESYLEAEETVQKILDYGFDSLSQFGQVYVIRLRGELCRRTNQPGAVSDLTKAWEMSCERFGRYHGRTMSSFQHLQDALNGGQAWVII